MISNAFHFTYTPITWRINTLDVLSGETEIHFQIVCNLKLMKYVNIFGKMSDTGGSHWTDRSVC